MATRTVPIEPTVTTEDAPNGAAMAAYLGGAIGAFAMGAIVLLNEAGIFAAPALYGPAGGVTGRTTLAVVVWLIAWVLLHFRWKDRDLEARRIYPMALILIAVGLLGTFPPVWQFV